MALRGPGALPDRAPAGGIAAAAPSGGYTLSAARPRAAFYCVSDARFFLGAVGLVNSLRLVGHREPIFLLDCGLTRAQRELVAPHVTLVPGPSGTPPYLLKTLAPLHHPADVMVLIDVDMIATRSLADLMERARDDHVLAVRNDRDRFVAEWGELLDLGTARRRPYVSSGLVVLGGRLGDRVLRLLDDRQGRVDFSRSFYGTRDPSYPFMFPEQDVLNAILCSAVRPAAITALESRLAATPPYSGLRLLDEERLRCAYADGTPPYVLHQFVRKPWLEPMYHGIYSRLLARLLLGEDVAVRTPERDIPVRMRNGIRARAERSAVNVVDLGRWYLGERLPRWIGARAESVRRARAARGL